jgi:hypothetical protein
MACSLHDHVGGAGPPLLLVSDLVHQATGCKVFPHWRSRALVVLKSFVSDSSKLLPKHQKPFTVCAAFLAFFIFLMWLPNEPPQPNSLQAARDTVIERITSKSCCTDGKNRDLILEPLCVKLMYCSCTKVCASLRMRRRQPLFWMQQRHCYRGSIRERGVTMG